MVFITLKMSVYSLLNIQKFFSCCHELRIQHFVRIHNATCIKYLFSFLLSQLHFAKKTIMQHLKAKTPLKTPFNEQNSPKLAKISKKQ